MRKRVRLTDKERKHQLDSIYDEEQKAPPTERTREIFERKAYQTRTKNENIKVSREQVENC